MTCLEMNKKEPGTRFHFLDLKLAMTLMGGPAHRGSF